MKNFIYHKPNVYLIVNLIRPLDIYIWVYLGSRLSNLLVLVKSMNIGYIYVLVYFKYYCETHYCLPSPFLGRIYVVREVTIQMHENYYVPITWRGYFQKYYFLDKPSPYSFKNST